MTPCTNSSYVFKIAPAFYLGFTRERVERFFVSFQMTPRAIYCPRPTGWGGLLQAKAMALPSNRLRLLPVETAKAPTTPRGEPKISQSPYLLTTNNHFPTSFDAVQSAATRPLLYNLRINSYFEHFYWRKRVHRVCESKMEEQSDAPPDKLDRPTTDAFSRELTHCYTHMCYIISVAF
jgi:hypothetical protein